MLWVAFIHERDRADKSLINFNSMEKLLLKITSPNNSFSSRMQGEARGMNDKKVNFFITGPIPPALDK